MELVLSSLSHLVLAAISINKPIFHFREAAEARKADDLAHSYTVCALITLI